MTEIGRGWGFLSGSGLLMGVRLSAGGGVAGEGKSGVPGFPLVPKSREKSNGEGDIAIVRCLRRFLAKMVEKRLRKGSVQWANACFSPCCADNDDGRATA